MAAHTVGCGSVETVISKETARRIGSQYLTIKEQITTQRKDITMCAILDEWENYGRKRGIAQGRRQGKERTLPAQGILVHQIPTDADSSGRCGKRYHQRQHERRRAQH